MQKKKKRERERLYKIFSFSNPITSLTMQAPSSESLGVFSSLFPFPFNYFFSFSSSSSFSQKVTPFSKGVFHRALTLPSGGHPTPLCPFPQFWSFRHILQVPTASHSPTWWSGEGGTRCGVHRACLSVLVLGLQQVTQFSWVSTGSIAPTVRWMRVLAKPVK